MLLNKVVRQEVPLVCIRKSFSVLSECIPFASWLATQSKIPLAYVEFARNVVAIVAQNIFTDSTSRKNLKFEEWINMTLFRDSGYESFIGYSLNRPVGNILEKTEQNLDCVTTRKFVLLILKSIAIISRYKKGYR